MPEPDNSKVEIPIDADKLLNRSYERISQLTATNDRLQEAVQFLVARVQELEGKSAPPTE